MWTKLLIIMGALISPSLSADCNDQFDINSASNTSLKVIIPADTTAASIQQSIRNAIRTELPTLTPSFYPIKTQQYIKQTNKLDPAWSRIYENIYLSYFAHPLSKKSKSNPQTKAIAEQHKNKLRILLWNKKLNILWNLEACLLKLKSFSFFSCQNTRFALIRNLAYCPTMERQNNAINALTSIFSHLKKKQESRYIIEKESLNIIDSIFKLFEIPNIQDVNPIDQFISLYDANNNSALSFLELIMIERFYTSQHKQGKSLAEYQEILTGYLNFLSPHLYQMSSLDFFSTHEIMLTMIEEFLSWKDHAQKDNIISFVIQLFKHLNEKRNSTGSGRLKMINMSTLKQAKALIKLSECLFNIPSMHTTNLTRLFTDLHYTNTDIKMTVLLLGITKEFFSFRYQEANATGQPFDIFECTETLRTATEHMRQHFFYTGKIENHQLSRIYMEELIKKLNIPHNHNIEATLTELFFTPCGAAPFTIEPQAFDTSCNLGRDTPLAPPFNSPSHDTESGLTAKQAIQKQRENLVAKGIVAYTFPLPIARFPDK